MGRMGATPERLRETGGRTTPRHPKGLESPEGRKKIRAEMKSTRMRRRLKEEEEAAKGEWREEEREMLTKTTSWEKIGVQG